MSLYTRIFSITALFLLFSGKTFCQYGISMTLYHVEKMKQTETILILDYADPHNKNIDLTLNKAMLKVWKSNQFQVMNKEEAMSNYRNLNNKDFRNPQYSFIYITYGTSAYGNHPTDRRMILTYFLTEKATRNPTDPVTAIAQSELNYDLYDLESGLIKDLQLLQSQIESGVFAKAEAADPSIKLKTLYIPVSFMQKGSEEKLKIYPYKYKIVSKEVLSYVIKTKPDSLCFIEQTNIDSPMMTVIDLGTGKPLYHAKAGPPVVGFIDDIKSLKKSLK
jgi:hypothetical protein